MRGKIFIVEDDFTIQTQLKTLLSGNGYEARAVTDFAGIIEQFKAFAHFTPSGFAGYKTSGKQRL